MDKRHQKITDDQVFLIMGVNTAEEASECAIVMAKEIHEARRAFERRYQGFMAMTWPSLQEIKTSVAMLETARNGGTPEQIPVINAMWSSVGSSR